MDDLKGSFEPEVYRALKALQKKHQFTFEYEPDAFSYIIEHWYTPDWKIQTKDGKEFYIESKGYWRPDDRSKLQHILSQHENIDIRMLFQNNPKLHKNSPNRYSDYCERHKISYSIGAIPESWF